MFIDRRLGDVPRYYLHPPEDAKMRVPDEVRECVAFLERPNTSGGFTVVSTAFFVGMPLGPIAGKTHAACYIVTTKHTADTLAGTKFGIRVNSQSGNAITIQADE